MTEHSEPDRGKQRFGLESFPELSSERLRLREVDVDDAEQVFVVRGDPKVQLYNSEPHRSLDDTRAFIEEERRLYREGREIYWGIELREGPGLGKTPV